MRDKEKEEHKPGINLCANRSGLFCVRIELPMKASYDPPPCPSDIDKGNFANSLLGWNE